jgi:predicted HAD superfamily Cof-like phosphohydrolase
MATDEPAPVSALRLAFDFYRLVDKPIRDRPTIDIPQTEMRQILHLLDEEVTELKLALGGNDLRGVVDALGDIVYVTYGAALQFGVDLERVVLRIHQANMSKPNSDGSILKSSEGKILRGDAYEPPALLEIPALEEATILD